MVLVFVFTAVPLLFFVATWMVVTVCRLYTPTSAAVQDDSLWAFVRQQSLREPLPVGARQIREDQRRYQRTLAGEPYQFLVGASEGLPQAWQDDLWQRRN